MEGEVVSTLVVSGRILVHRRKYLSILNHAINTSFTSESLICDLLFLELVAFGYSFVFAYISEHVLI